MWNTQEQGLDELVRAGTHLAREMEFRALVPILVEQAFDISSSDLACLYLNDPEDSGGPLHRAFQRGGQRTPARLEPEQEWISFLREVGEAVLLLDGAESPFSGLLLHPEMRSGIALPLSTATVQLGVLVLNSAQPEFYDRRRFYFLDSFVKLAGGLLHNARLFQELKEYLARIEALERYQENIFASMTNLLVTTDAKGNLRYFNEAAGERFGLSNEQIGEPLNTLWAPSIDRGILRAIGRAQSKGEELLGVEGIYRRDGGEIDFALNVSPLWAGEDSRRRHQGTTLLFTDQSREKALQGQVARVVEERRAIKDMFSRYLSNDILQVLMEQPDLVKPGGESRMATVLFGDIRGYTSFSEAHEPEIIVKVLNEYFSEVVDVILRFGGYIDKFIGDAVMAAWGIPVSRDGDEISSAVAAAVTIQRAIASTRRKFFRGEADGLRVGIGMHTGPLVAGNLGSAQRMDYTVIGDTVNVAARLEGVAKGGEVIITQSTREGLDDRFVVEQRKPVTVKGKSQPLPIYAVLDMAG